MAPFGQRYCEVCDVYITRKNFCQHLKTRRHLEKVKTNENQYLATIDKTEDSTLKRRKILESKNSGSGNESVIDIDYSGNVGSGQSPYSNVFVEDILHFMKQISRPINDSTPPCTCSKCVEAIKYLGLTVQDSNTNLNDIDKEIESEENKKVVDEKCIDFNRAYQSLIVFPPSNSIDQGKVQIWKSIIEFAKKFDEKKLISIEQENKENIPPPNFAPRLGEWNDSPHPSIEFARQHDTHRCTQFGEELPEYIKFLHCHEETFHFFCVKDERTNCRLGQHFKSKAHKDQVDRKKKLRCNICTVQFGRGIELDKHRRSEEHATKWREIREAAGQTTSDLVTNSKPEFTSIFECAICGESFPNAKAVSDHEKTNKHKRRVLMDQPREADTSNELFHVYKARSAMKGLYCLYMMCCENRKVNSHLETFMIESTDISVGLIQKELRLKKVLKVAYNISALYCRSEVPGNETAGKAEEQKLLKSRQYIFTLVGSQKIEQVLQNKIYPEVLQANERILLAGSDWRFDQVVWGELVFNTFDVMKCGISGSSYIPLPEELSKRRSILNLKNDDDKCFMYSIFSYFYKHDIRKRHLMSTYRDTDAVISYIQAAYSIEFDFSNLSFPVPLHDINKFEKNNPRVSINVFGLTGASNCRLYPLKSVDREKEFHFDLLYLKQGSDSIAKDDGLYDERYSDVSEDEDDDERLQYYKSHYCLILDLAMLLNSQVSSNGHRISVCKRCFATFRGNGKEERLVVHKFYCNENTVVPARYALAKEGEKFRYIMRGNECPLDYCMFADFETMLKDPSQEENEANEEQVDTMEEEMEVTFPRRIGRARTSHLHVLREHIPSCYASYLTSPNDRWNDEVMGDEDKARVYLGEDAAQNFINYAKCVGYKVMDAVNRFPNVPDMDKDERERILFTAKKCILCQKQFELLETAKCIHHCHRTGKIIGVAHNSCNLKFKRQTFLPIYFHNGSRYDFHLIMQSSFQGCEIKVIPHTEERYVSFIVYLSRTFSLHFIDTYRFLSDSLKNLSKLLGSDEFHNVNDYFRNDELSDLAKQKSFYPYEYVSSFEKYNEISLPPQDAFHDTATGNRISDEDYSFACNVWEKFECQSLGDYTKIYCLIDVLILSDVFCAFRAMCIRQYKLDPARYVTLPSYSFDVMKKLSGAKLDLFTDRQINMYCFFENAIRGGIVNVVRRYVKANSKLMPEIYDPSKVPEKIEYIDANGLYSWAMQQYLPVSHFKALSEEDVALCTPETIMNLHDESDWGYYFDVDIDYPRELHDKHNDFPFLCEKKVIDNVEKLVCTLENKRNYHVHYRTLKQALKHGLVLKKINKIIKFKQAPILRSYINLNTRLRANSQSPFEKSMYKLMCNAIFGKTIENARKRMNFTLATNVEQYKKLVCRTNFKESVYFNPNLVGVNRYKTSVSLKLPIYLGASILDISKTLMYEFFYEKMPLIFGNVKYNLCYMDTDSFIFSFNDHSFAPYLQKYIHLFDLSDYPISHKLFDQSNRKVPGVFKDELCGKNISEFVALTPKVYAYKIYETGEEKKKAKGVLSSIVKKELHIDLYKDVLFNNAVIMKPQHLFNVHLHNIRTIRQNKVALALRCHCKRVFFDNINSYAYGHYNCISIDNDNNDVEEDADELLSE
ncbi:hypothetical protein V9T40_004942 [Parthenolecanium corni]|uniref:C2H2-type domain-containing protein n=1 Tax=Parthenolecanium corni TaxID=536013 RepID=A0AAN9TGY1_9HEMI